MKGFKRMDLLGFKIIKRTLLLSLGPTINKFITSHVLKHYFTLQNIFKILPFRPFEPVIMQMR
jgi:hypothetical protein